MQPFATLRRNLVSVHFPLNPLSKDSIRERLKKEKNSIMWFRRELVSGRAGRAVCREPWPVESQHADGEGRQENKELAGAVDLSRSIVLTRQDPAVRQAENLNHSS